MTAPTEQATVRKLLQAFKDAPVDRRETEYERLVDALWRDGKATASAARAVPAIVEHLGQVTDDKKGYLAILLGLLAETGAEQNAATREHLDRFLALVGRRPAEPLTLALVFLLAHFPDDRERILAAVRPLRLDPDDQSRLDRCLQRLDPARPKLGQVWPSPAVWRMSAEEERFHEMQIESLTPEQVRTNWINDTRTLLGYSGAKANWAVRNGAPAPVVPPELPEPGASQVDPRPRLDLFRRHEEAFRCPACGSALVAGPDEVRCAGCSRAFPAAGGILDLTSGGGDDTHEATADLLKKLADMPTIGLRYEAFLRPGFLRISGSNWGGTVTAADEDDYIARHLRPVDGPVLDLAAGAGRWTTVVANTVGADRVIALDVSLPMLNIMRGVVPEVPAVLGSALALPFGDSTLGAVNCWNALQAFPDDAPRAVAEVGRCLRPGGTLTMMTYHWDPQPVGRHFQAAHYFPSRPDGMLLFEIDEVKAWLADAGMTVRHEWTPGTFYFVTAERTA